MFSTLQKAIVMLALVVIALGVAFASATALSTGATLAASPTSQPISIVTATPLPNVQTHRLATLNLQKTRVAAATTNGIMVWALDTGKVLVTFDTQNHTVTDLTFTPDGLWLAASLNNGSVLVWAVP
jgi:WD40 repeat protein